MNPPNEKARSTASVPWLLLIVIWALVVSSLWLLSYNVIYTEGEVMHGMFTLGVILVAACILLGFHSRTTALACVGILGGLLLLWQAYQTRKWAMIHEDVIEIVRFAEDARKKTGRYPVSLEGYAFRNPTAKARIHSFAPEESDGFRLTYFMNDPGITYWYSSKTGFGYYPD